MGEGIAPNLGLRLLFEELTRGVSKTEVELVAAQSLVRVRNYGP